VHARVDVAESGCAALSLTGQVDPSGPVDSRHALFGKQNRIHSCVGSSAESERIPAPPGVVYDSTVHHLIRCLAFFGLGPGASAQGGRRTGRQGRNQKEHKQEARARDKNAAVTPSASPSPTPPPCQTVQETVSSPQVVDCIHSSADTTLSHAIYMNSIIERGDNVSVPIVGLKEWANDKTQKDHDPHALRLFLAGHLLPKDEPSLIELEQEYLNFQLTTLSTASDTDEKKAWLQIFTEARRQKGGRVPITVGLPKDLQPFYSESFISVRVYPAYTAYVVVGLGILLVALLVLGWRSDLLRDLSQGAPPKPARAPYSLGRMQMAWWFYLVIAAYVYIALITKEVNSLTPTALTLIGISAGTGLAAVFVDKQKLSDQANQKVALESEKAVVVARIALLQQSNPAAGTAESFELQEKQKRLQEITTLLLRFPTTQVSPSSKGIIDVLKDSDGLSFHRFQIAIWTIVLGLVFIRSVLLQLVMPDFDKTLLGLMGISSGTYIGFKFPEKLG
jgi:hypothetical protein